MGAIRKTGSRSGCAVSIETLERRQFLSAAPIESHAVHAGAARLPAAARHAPLRHGQRDPARRLMVLQRRWSGPVVITRGGIYRGRWQSLEPDVPAVIIRTTQPVIIVNSSIRSAGDGIIDGVDGINLTVLRTTDWGLNPNVAGRPPGRFVSVEHFVRMDIENCVMAHTAGIYLGYYIGNHTTGNTVKVVRNAALDIDGRYSDGQGGFMTGPDDHEDVQFCQIAYTQGIPGVEIAWNQVVNQPYQSRVEDNISIYRSSGTPTSPILIHDNYIQGAYPANPATQDYSGGGIMLADGTAPNPDQECACVQAYGNQVVSTTNYGIIITTGHDLSFHNNRMVSCGYLPDGTWIVAQNVGASVWNADSDPLFANNLAYDNVIGWVDKNAAGVVTRNDRWLPGITVPVLNTALPDPITRQTEMNVYVLWVSKLWQNQVSVGPSPTARRLAASGSLTAASLG